MASKHLFGREKLRESLVSLPHRTSPVASLMALMKPPNLECGKFLPFGFDVIQGFET